MGGRGMVDKGDGRQRTSISKEMKSLRVLQVETA